MDFVNPTRGKLDLREAVQDMLEFVGEAPQDEYRIIIGSDSHTKESRNTTTFVTAMIVHRVGKGAKYYYHRRTRPVIKNLRQRIFTEASLSLMLCGQLREIPAMEHAKNMEVHLDIGNDGATQALIKELVAWVEGSGYEAKIKPNSFVASKVADRYTRMYG